MKKLYIGTPEAWQAEWEAQHNRYQRALADEQIKQDADRLSAPNKFDPKAAEYRKKQIKLAYEPGKLDAWLAWKKAKKSM